MSAAIISGTAIASTIREELRERVTRLRERDGLTPGLATVLVGDDPASYSYVTMKNRAARAAGIYSRQITLPGSTSEVELTGVLDGLNADPAIHGILVQLPLPGQIRDRVVLDRVLPEKDVDGFHPVNVGRLATGTADVLAPCTPAGVIQMLVRSGVDPAGRHAVIVGRSNIVGKPMSSLLVRKAPGGNATVTIAHSRTPDLGAVTRLGEILIVAIGRPGTITGAMVRPGATVIDVGTNRVEDATRERGYRIVGDVMFDEVSEVAGKISPVPGGVGPMTIAMLLSNTVDAAVRLHADGAGG